METIDYLNDMGAKLKISYKHKPKPTRYPGKMDIKVVVDNSMYDDWYNGLTEKEKTEYWNRQCRKGEANL